MKSKTFYRVANHQSQQGLWYDFNGVFTGLIHNEFSFCTNHNLLMPYDPNIIGWLSATETLDELFLWFTEGEIQKLEEHGYTIALYEATEFKMYNNHWIIKQDTSKLVKTISVSDVVVI